MITFFLPNPPLQSTNSVWKVLIFFCLEREPNRVLGLQSLCQLPYIKLALSYVMSLKEVFFISWNPYLKLWEYRHFLILMDKLRTPLLKLII